MPKQQKPVVLVIAGHDPSGGAGIQADIETIAHAGCHAVTAITALTIQNTQKVAAVIPQQPEHFKEQLQYIFDDFNVSACKLGLLSSALLIDVIYEQLSTRKVPIILDPIIYSGSGTLLADSSACHQLKSLLLPITTIVTPNSIEARALAGRADLASAAARLLALGSKYVLITGTHDNTQQVTHTLYKKGHPGIEYNWPRLSGNFHGSGCTLSARIAAQLAQGKAIPSAVAEAQQYTWNTLYYGLKIGQGQWHPNRFFNFK